MISAPTSSDLLYYTERGSGPPFDSRRRLAQIRCPTLIVAGSNDNAVPIHHAKTLHNGIPGSQLVLIDGADHALLWTHSNELMRATDEFLSA